MEECFQYAPDFYIFCEGQNEFLEDVTYSGTRRLTAVMEPLLSIVRHLQCVRALVNCRTGTDLSQKHAQSSRPLLREEVQTLLDQAGGLDRYHRNDEHTDTVVRHFQFNLERMTALCRQKNVPLLLIQPPVNLSDCPPFKSQFSEDTPAEKQAEILQTLREARKRAKGDTATALSLIQSIVRQEPRFALGWYELGQMQLTIGDLKNARTSLERALDEDVCPLRMKNSLRHAMQLVARTHNIPFLNAQELLGRRCPGGILGEQVLVDHVHPSFRGHEDIAVEIAVLMEQQGFVQSQVADWQQAARHVCRQAVQELDDTYFLQGRRALQALRQWAAGRALEPDLVHSTESDPTTTASE
jgi:tetratricopeptide (TPR) repeat protein